MGVITDYAATVAAAIDDAGARATNNIRNAVPPCVLVVPVPVIDYDVLCGSTATFTAVCLAKGMGDLEDAKVLEDLVEIVRTVVPVTRAEPSAYQIPSSPDPKPAYLCTFQAQITPEEES